MSLPQKKKKLNILKRSPQLVKVGEKYQNIAYYRFERKDPRKIVYYHSLSVLGTESKSSSLLIVNFTSRKQIRQKEECQFLFCF